jgi:lipid A 4'-phosphatase
LIVNLLLKDHWGRPRPSTLVEFGGSNHYVPPFIISDQCERNCSFSSGHGALGFWLVALALLAPARWTKPAIMIALLLGSVVGYIRIAQGGHFLSDVVVSALVTIVSSVWLHRILFLPRPQQSRKNNHFPD